MSRYIQGLIRQDHYKSLVMSVVAAWDRWIIFPGDYTLELKKAYWRGTTRELSFDTRLSRQESEGLGLYAPGYEPDNNESRKRKNQEEEDMRGFKRTNQSAWVSIDSSTTATPSLWTKGSSFESLSNPILLSRATDDEGDFATPSWSSQSQALTHPATSNQGEDDEDLDGVPLQKPGSFVQKDMELKIQRLRAEQKVKEMAEQEEEDDEDLDGEPLVRPPKEEVEDDEDLDGIPLQPNSGLELQEEDEDYDDLDGIPLRQ
jgi:hypothetical protein